MALFGDLTFDSRVRKEARSLANAGYRVTIVCLASEGGHADLPGDVEVLVVDLMTRAVSRGLSNPFFTPTGGRLAAAAQRAGWLVGYVRTLRSWGRRAIEAAGPVDAWHAHDLTGLAAIVPFLPRQTPLVYDSHELFLETGTARRLPYVARRLLRRYERSLVARALAVVTVNDEIARILSRRYRPRRIEVVHNCPERWRAPEGMPLLIRDAANIPQQLPIVLYHGGLTTDRGIETLMDAMLDPSLADAHLVLMGYGSMRDELSQRSRSGPWGTRVHVLDPVPPSELLAWVAGADVGVMPNPGTTWNDRLSSPNKLFECIAAGTPVVVSDYPTMRRIVLDDPAGPLGAVCDPSNPAAVAGAIASIVTSTAEQRGALRARCRRAAADRWNWEAEAAGLLSIYADIAPPEATTGS
jgi:glycosyltransferase involved in cell wall biosynthesis